MRFFGLKLKMRSDAVDAKSELGRQKGRVKRLTDVQVYCVRKLWVKLVFMSLD